MNRRNFIGTVLALASAPAIVRASSLMPVRALATPVLIGHIDNFGLYVTPFDAERWTERMTQKFYEATVFGRAVVTDYAEEFASGIVVRRLA